MLRATLYVPGRTQMETVGLYKNPWLCTTLRIRSPKQRFIRTFVSRPHFPAQRKGGGISKGGNPGSPLWLRAVRHALHRTSGSSGQTRHAQPTLTTFNITYRRAARVYSRTTERMECTITRIACSVTLPQCEHAPSTWVVDVVGGW